MIYSHTVFADGKIYPPGTDVPGGDPTAESIKTTVEPIVADTSAVEPTNNVPQYTKRQIELMKADEVREYAKTLGFSGVEELTGTEIKRNIYKMFNMR